MEPEDSPFPCRWRSFSLEKAGLGDLRPRDGTYGEYDFFALPPAPPALCGDWTWLRSRPRPERSIAEEIVISPQGHKRGVSLESFDLLQSAAKAAGYELPKSFVTFLSNRELTHRIRSNTDCFLDVSPGVSTPEKHAGLLARFLSDSQGCVFWYLHLAPNGDHAVLSSIDFYGSPDEEEEYYGDDIERKHGLSFTAESFETFMWRIWIENEIWYAGLEGRELSPEGRRYVDAYRGAKANPGPKPKSAAKRR